MKLISKLVEFNDEANEFLRDETFIPTVKFVYGLLIFAVLLDCTSQLCEAIEWLTL